MNEFFNNLKQEAYREHLSSGEKQRMRIALYDAMDESRSAPAPMVAQVRMTHSTFVWFSPRFASALAAFLVIVLGTGSGVAYAAEGSLPGDALYTVKINVTEPAIGALAIGDDAKAQWHAGVAQTRLEEAESLASQGKLDATTSEQLAANFDEHASEAQALSQKVGDTDPAEAADIEAQFDSSLAAHDALLSKISEGTTSSDSAQTLVLHVRERGGADLALEVADTSGESDGKGQPAAKVMAVSTFAATAPGASGTASSTGSASSSASAKAKVSLSAAQQKTVAKLQKTASSTLAGARADFAGMRSSLDATTTAKIQTQFDGISAAINVGASVQTLTQALRDATVLKAFLEASAKFKRNLFTNTSNSGKGPGDQNQNQGKDNAGSSAAATTTASTTLNSNASQDNSDNNGSGNEGSGGADNSGPGNSRDGFIRSLLNGV